MVKNSTILAKNDHLRPLYIRTLTRHNSSDNRHREGTKMTKTDGAKVNTTERKGSLSVKLCLPDTFSLVPYPFRH